MIEVARRNARAEEGEKSTATRTVYFFRAGSDLFGIIMALRSGWRAADIIWLKRTLKIYNMGIICQALLLAGR